jgi:hypothetical protein
MKKKKKWFLYPYTKRNSWCFFSVMFALVFMSKNTQPTNTRLHEHNQRTQCGKKTHILEWKNVLCDWLRPARISQTGRPADSTWLVVCEICFCLSAKFPRYTTFSNDTFEVSPSGRMCVTHRFANSVINARRYFHQRLAARRFRKVPGRVAKTGRLVDIWLGGAHFVGVMMMWGRGDDTLINKAKKIIQKN